MNEHRNFVSNQFYSKLTEYVNKHGLEAMPEMEDLLKVVLRQMEVPTQEDPQPVHDEFERLMVLAVVYWDLFLPPVAGGSTFWRESVRHHQTISTATWNGVECVDVSSEAMCMLFYENNFQKWKECFKEENNDCGRKPDWKMPKKKSDPNTVKFQGKFSSSTAGSNRYGGWNRDGRLRFNELKTLIAKARKEPHVANLEGEILKRVRMAHRKDADDVDPEACNNGKKKRKKRNFDDMVDCM